MVARAACQKVGMPSPNSDRIPVVLIFADSIPPPRMPFVPMQAGALKNFEPYLVGIRRYGTAGLPFPADHMLAINGTPGLIGKIREAPFRRFGFAPIFFRRVRRLRPVLLHAHSGFSGLSSLSMAMWFRIPLVTTFHGRDATIDDLLAVDSHFGWRDYARRQHVLASKGQLFIAVSRFMKSKMLERGFPEERTVVHYIGVDTDFFQPDPLLVREPIVLFVGRLEEMKGCEYAIQAMAKVQTSVPGVELVIIGDGPLRPDLERMAREKLRRYKFLGVQPCEVVRHWMNRARVFAVPSVRARTGETETFGMVFAEAQSMCLPVTSFASGGIPEAVADGETGLLAKERDWESLAHNIQELLCNEEAWQRMSEAGRNRVCTLFNLKTQTTTLEEIYRKIAFSAHDSIQTRAAEGRYA